MNALEETDHTSRTIDSSKIHQTPPIKYINPDTGDIEPPSTLHADVRSPKPTTA